MVLQKEQPPIPISFFTAAWSERMDVAARQAEREGFAVSNLAIQM
jgi:hypothetical protein